MRLMVYRPKVLRSLDPVCIALEILGDRWTLLIIRDLMVHDRHSFRELLEGGEGISTNVLSDRLRRLEWHGLVGLRIGPGGDSRRIEYHLTQRGIDLAPCLVAMIRWATLYEETSLPEKPFLKMRVNPDGYVRDLRTRWRTSQAKLRAEGPTIRVSSHGKTRRLWDPRQD